MYDKRDELNQHVQDKIDTLETETKRANETKYDEFDSYDPARNKRKRSPSPYFSADGNDSDD